ncbi:MAG TPA: hypothetical protein VEO54_11405 [Thermoanaerobaculia bacterium]|nr:hypothetical protein [Thermoanaerobaculia bacterium]
MHRLFLPLIAFLGAALVAAPLSAHRVEFVATVDDERAAGSEVCFFPAAASDHSFGLFLSSGDVRCLPADQVIEIPPGKWNFFTRHERGLISSTPTTITISTRPYVPELGFRTVRVPMYPSATLDFRAVRERLEPGMRLVAYYPLPPARGSSAAHPLAADTDTLSVPAYVPVVPLVVAAGRVVHILAPVTPDEGTVTEVEWREPKAGLVDVVSWVKLNREGISDDELSAIDGSIELALRDGDSELRPAFAPPPGAAAHLSLQLFLDVPASAAELVLRGKSWKEQRLRVAGERHGRTVNVLDPLTAAPAATPRRPVATHVETKR